MLTKQEIIQALPPNLKSAVTDQFVDMVNDITQDQQAAEYIRENFITYTMVLKEGRFKTEDYLNAVAYVSYKHMGLSNKEAFFKTFPQRQVALVAKGTSEKDIAAHVAGYHKGKLVNLIMEKSLVPTWVAYQDVYHKAIAVQADLMQNAQSEKVRSDAANSILTHLAKPKEAAAVVNVDLRENSGMKELVATLTQLAGAQRQAISDGTDAKVISGANLIREKEVTNV
ncbi:hypothetical protein Axy04_074 [Achromobacter phage vB_AxyP_19-32_Axy04]|uniref:Uncharacterized protein n=1 Tax=Achromobacter phage vB_AxyP_19-32_Axy04 TaxID=2591039 RepID=A0A514CTG4_9CAUD|nr:hypothetical protein KMC55_gp40 [Achromobacter phage vB_AxyP_19-32_Axy04]QDH83756.1 hypothetical protein Axy04_074 [Achromobacter phage vB_AxyP_19-32_Axy04]